GGETPMSDSHSDALVFYGVTGDLAFKKIFPALQAMVKRGHLNVPVVECGQIRLDCRSTTTAGAREPRKAWRSGSGRIRQTRRIIAVRVGRLRRPRRLQSDLRSTQRRKTSRDLPRRAAASF